MTSNSSSERNTIAKDEKDKWTIGRKQLWRKTFNTWQRRLCKTLTAVLLCELRGSVRIDHVLRLLDKPTRAQHPELLAIAKQLEKILQTEVKLDVIDHLVGGLKNPERSKLNISKELLDAVSAYRKRKSQVRSSS
jgi:hypothetical protein